MGTYTKIKSIGFSRLNSAEYMNFMTRFRALINKKSAVETPESVSTDSNKLGITEAQLTSFDTDLALLSDLVKNSRISDETAAMLEVDKERDDLIIYLSSVIKQARKVPVEAQKTAAQSLYNIIKPYLGIYKSANQQETAQINGLLGDLAKEGVPAMLQTLGLTEVVESLRAANEQYATLTDQRSNTQAANVKETATAIRARIDDLYDDMTTIAFVTSVASPSAEAATFISELNNVIDEVSNLNKQRIGTAKAAAAKKQDTPAS